MRGVATAALLCVVLGVGGCSGDGSAVVDSEQVSAESRAVIEEHSSQRPVSMRVRVESTGAAQFTWEGVRDVLLTRTGESGSEVNLLSVGFDTPEALPERPTDRFRWGIDLLSAYEDKPGTFTITSDPVTSQGIKNVVLFIWMRVVGDKASEAAVFDWEDVVFLERFEEIRQPCTLQVGEQALSGSVTCPELATKGGLVSAVTITWQKAD